MRRPYTSVTSMSKAYRAYELLAVLLWHERCWTWQVVDCHGNNGLHYAARAGCQEGIEFAMVDTPTSLHL